MAEPFYGLGQTPGIPEEDPAEVARKKAMLDYFLKEQGENFGAIPRALGAAFSLPQAPAQAKPQGLIDPNAPDFGQQAKASFEANVARRGPSAGGSEPAGPPSAYDRTAELDALEKSYNERVQAEEHPDLGFSWGGGETKAWRPGMDTRSGEFGEAPAAGQGFGQTWDTPAKGGAFSQSDIEKIPIGQRPQSWFEDQMAGSELAKINAERKRAEMETERPFMREEIAADATVRSKMAAGEQEQQQIQAYYAMAAKVETQRQAALAELRSHPQFGKLDPAQQEMEIRKVNDQFDREGDVLDFAFHGRTRSKGTGLL